MTLDDKIAYAKKLIDQRQEIDAELTALFGFAPPPKRGRPRKENVLEPSLEPNNHPMQSA